MPGVFELALPRSAVENSSELTRSLQLNDEVIIAICIALHLQYCLHYGQVVLAEQQPLLLRELRTLPLETKPIVMETSDGGQGTAGRDSRSSDIAYFKYPTDPLWGKQWSLVSCSNTVTSWPHYPLSCAVQHWASRWSFRC